jgi:plasmid stabilization system protein ParE
MARIVWSTPALAQLEAIGAAIEVDKPLAARKVVGRVWHEVGRLAAFPRLGRPIPEFRRPEYRQLWVQPCWIYYRTGPQVIVILHIRRAERPLDLSDLE